MSLLQIPRKTILVTLLAVTGITAVAVTAALQYQAMGSYRALGEAKVLVSDIESNVLTLRRNEKDFLARKDPLYRQRFARNYEIILGNIEKLGTSMAGHEIDEPSLDALRQVIVDYRNMFLAMADLQKKIGFHHEDGYYGDLRKAIHRVEEILEFLRQHRLLKDMLMLRRHEKDFMLRKDERYIDKFEKDIGLMRTDLSRAYLDPAAKREIATALSAYEDDFDALVAATREMGFNSNDGLHGAMRARIHQSEGILYELRQQILAFESEAGSRMINQLIVSAVVLTLLIAILIRL